MNKHIKHKTFNHYLRDTSWNMLVSIATTEEIGKAVVLSEENANHICEILNAVEGRICWITC